MKLSIILPVYNEEQNIGNGTIGKVLSFLKNKYDYELVIVDDGSSDNTVRLIKEEYGSNNKIRLIEKNHEGKAYSIIRGIKESKGDIIFFTDFDLATPIQELDKLVKEVKNGYDIVIGSRSNIRKGAPFARKVLSKGLTVIRDIMIGLNGIKDTQCGFKAFKSKSAQAIIKKFKVFGEGHTIHGPSVSAAFDLEFLYIAKKSGYKIKEVPVEWRHVETRNVNFMRDATESLKDILMIRIYALMGKYN